MRNLMAILAVIVILLVSVVPVTAGQTEQDIVAKYLRKAKEKQTRHLSWLSGHFGMNRINRENDYNAFATYQSNLISNGSIEWLGEAKSFGIDAGFVFAERFGWSLGGEYWMKMGTNQSGSFDYSPGGTSMTIENLKSEIQVWGVTAGLQYFVMNPPSVVRHLTRPSVRVGASVGFYQASWDLFKEYQNLNLATSTPENTNITYKGTGVGFSANLGGDYPLGWNGLVLGADIGYLMLNFKNVSWYNAQDQEIVATYNGTPEGRVNLDLSGVRGRVEIKRFFSW